MEELEELLDEQEDEYKTLMEEKRIEEERLANEIAVEFLRNRSARVIQRCWRAYKERKAARKKGRKGEYIASTGSFELGTFGTTTKLGYLTMELLQNR